jgi:Iron-containing redox enzyme
MPTTTLSQFIEQWDINYSKSISTIKLFKSETEFTNSQKESFVKYFYHARGHYYKFLWFLGSFQTEQVRKDLILDNIREEFGYRSKAHEQHYIDFAKSLQVDLKEEILYDSNYPESIKRFNFDHLKFIVHQNKNKTWAAFCAYERLDNVDYDNLAKITSKFGLNSRDLVFFSVHHYAQHFSPALPLLEEIWQSDEKSVRLGFQFIAQNQIQMRQSLSDCIFDEAQTISKQEVTNLKESYNKSNQINS